MKAWRVGLSQNQAGSNSCFFLKMSEQRRLELLMINESGCKLCLLLYRKGASLHSQVSIRENLFGFL